MKDTLYDTSVIIILNHFLWSNILSIPIIFFTSYLFFFIWVHPWHSFISLIWYQSSSIEELHCAISFLFLLFVLCWFFKMNEEQDESLSFHSSYYLHSSENPAIALVSPLLHPRNYNSWSRSALTALSAKNKVEFVYGSLPRPTLNHRLYGAWKRGRI